MARNTEYNQANLLTSIDKKMNRTLSEPSMWMGDEGRRLHHLGDQLNRDVVIVPESGTPEETQEAQKRFRQLADETEQRQIDEYPLYQEAYNNLMPGTALDVKEYSFPSPAWNSLANAPKYSVDLTTLASLGAAAPGSIAAATAKSAAARAGMQAGKNTIRQLAKTAYHSVPAYLATDYAIDLGTDQLTEQPYAMMLHSAQNDGEQPNWAAPMQRSNVSDDPGKPGDGGQYRKEFDQFKRKQSDNVRWLLDYQNRHHPIKLSPIGLE